MNKVLTHFERFKRKTHSALLNLDSLNSVSVHATLDYADLYIRSALWFVPDINLHASEDQQHWVVYILISPGNGEPKTNAGRPICSLPNMLAIYGFIGVYQFLYKFRSNKKNRD